MNQLGFSSWFVLSFYMILTHIIVLCHILPEVSIGLESV